MRTKSNFLMKKKSSIALLVLLLGCLFLSQATPGKADDPSSESVWVLTETLVNPDNAQLEFIGEEIQPDWAPKKEDGYFEGSFTRYTVTETSFQVDARRVSDGLESHNITLETLFEKLQPKFTPGEIIELTAVSSHSGTAVGFSTPTSEFWYTSKEVFIHPGGSTLWYAPWHDNFDGTNTKTFWFEVPPVTSSRTTFSIAASWRNAEPCLVIWKYQAQEVGGPRSADDSGQDAVTADDSGQDTTTTDDSGQDAVNVDDSGRINPWIPVIGIGAAGAVGAAVAAGAAAVAISRGKNGSKKTTDQKKDEKQDEKKEDPCADDLNRLRGASTQAWALFDGIQTLRSHLELLDTKYENIRQAAYWNASIDLGLLGASIFGGPAAVGLTGRAVASKTIDIAMRDSAATALGSEMMKSVTNGMLQQGVSWESLLKAPYGGAEGVVIQNVISECLTQRYQTSLVQRGVPAALQNSLVKGYSKQVAGHIASGFMQFISVGKIVYGAYTEVEKLEAIRENMSDLRKSLFELELLYEDALSEMRISRSVYEKCRKMWQL